MSSLGTLVVDRSLNQATDRRGSARDRVIKSAQMIFHNSIIDCIVMDISPAGAKVRTSSVVVVPENRSRIYCLCGKPPGTVPILRSPRSKMGLSPSPRRFSDRLLIA